MSLGVGVRKICLFVLVFGVFAPRAFAQSAVCQTGWDWATNSKGQNPCEIAGALEAACQGYNVFYLGPLPQGSNYMIPQKNSSTLKCDCSTVVYSLFMACTACQNCPIQQWTYWSQFCTQVYVAEYLEAIPLNTAIPHWAFRSYGVNDTFDSAVAQLMGGQPETLAPVPSTISASSSSTGSGSGSPPIVLTDPTSTPTGQDNSKPLNMGAMVGGLVGCLAILALGAIGVGAWVFFRRRAAARIDGDQPGCHRCSVVTSASDYSMTPLKMRPYDPSDPSTYPAHGNHETSGRYKAPANGVRYSGTPEL